ncbi:hypothetical protein Ahy_A04g019753 [Arachis hypogaea]|uniref:Uncharacterized protein n=1 Tax=Arachis hypogaea TaxID=3818 RepID=A0A445DGK0_ARAHY|nr:hypothetical protein Ahy_A04g019753 [Arachis hypogaea]
MELFHGLRMWIESEFLLKPREKMSWKSTMTILALGCYKKEYTLVYLDILMPPFRETVATFKLFCSLGLLVVISVILSLETKYQQFEGEYDCDSDAKENAENFAKLKGLLQGIIHATSNFELRPLWLPSRLRSKQHSSALQPADVQKRLKEMVDRRFMDATSQYTIATDHVFPNEKDNNKD